MSRPSDAFNSELDYLWRAVGEAQDASVRSEAERAEARKGLQDTSARARHLERRLAESLAREQRLKAETESLKASISKDAETLAMAGGKGLKGKPRQLVERALKLNPKHAHSLFLAGAAAMEAGDNKQGIAYWEALLPQVDPGSEIDQMLRSGIDKMKAGGKG